MFGPNNLRDEFSDPALLAIRLENPQVAKLLETAATSRHPL